MRRLVFLVLPVLALAIGVQAHPIANAAGSVQYSAGWNLVGGPDGSHLIGASGSLYTLQPGDSEYQTAPADAALKAGWGYWAYFPSGGSLNPGPGLSSYNLAVTAGQWIMVGNPSAAQALDFANIDVAYSYTPEGGFASITALGIGRGAFVMAQRQITLGVIVATTPPAVAPAAAAPAGSSAGTATGSNAETFTGNVSIDGQPAPLGTSVKGYIGATTCGSTTVSTPGQYALTVSATGGGCGTGAAPVQFGVTPNFGNEWKIGATVPFQPGTAVTRNILVDLKKLTPAPDNVPWEPISWANPQSMRIAICSSAIQSGASAAANTAFGWWRDAMRNDGLGITLVTDSSACDDTTPGVAIVGGQLREPRAIAGTGFFDADLNPCSFNSGCTALKALIVVNYRVFNTLDTSTQARAIAHEIGHSLGLDHAPTCDGGTLMYYQDNCAFPFNHVGVDDIASLNRKVGAPQAVSTPPGTINSVQESALLAGPDRLAVADGRMTGLVDSANADTLDDASQTLP